MYFVDNNWILVYVEVVVGVLDSNFVFLICYVGVGKFFGKMIDVVEVVVRFVFVFFVQFIVVEFFIVKFVSRCDRVGECGCWSRVMSGWWYSWVDGCFFMFVEEGFIYGMSFFVG